MKKYFILPRTVELEHHHHTQLSAGILSAYSNPQWMGTLILEKTSWENFFTAISSDVNLMSKKKENIIKY